MEGCVFPSFEAINRVRWSCVPECKTFPNICHRREHRIMTTRLGLITSVMFADGM